MQQLSLETRTQLDALLTVEIPETQAREEIASADLGTPIEERTEEAPLEPAPRPQSALHALKQDVGPLSLERVLQEIDKLERIHQLGLPQEMFAHVSARTLDSYRNRIAVEELQEVRRHPDPIRFTLLAAYCWRRRQEIVDTLVGTAIGHGGVRPLTGERVAWKGPSGERCEGQAACVEEWHSGGV